MRSEKKETSPSLEVDRLKAELDALRPASAAALKDLEDWYDYELTYTSNAIEGNTLTLMETTLVIQKGITIGGKRVVEHLEAEDHYAAVKGMRAVAATDRPVGEADVVALHEIITKRSRPEIAGMYAAHPRRIQGSRTILPRSEKLPALMEAFGRGLAGASGWRDAFEAHYALVTIHPFADGNGRTARLLMNLLLLRAGCTPVAIGPPERARYLEVLEARQLAEPLGHGVVDAPTRDAYVNFMAKRLIASLEDHLEVISPGRDTGRADPANGARPVPGSPPAGRRDTRQPSPRRPEGRGGR